MISYLDYISGKAARDLEGDIAGQKRLADADLAVNEQTELAQRNEATAARQNQSAMLNRQGTRAGGGRYRRRGLFMMGGSGLNAANSKALTEARKKASYARIDQSYAERLRELRNPLTTVSVGAPIRVY